MGSMAAPRRTAKCRPLNMATTQSKVKAKAVCELLLPYKPRPATSTAPARRLLQVPRDTAARTGQLNNYNFVDLVSVQL